MATQGVIGTRSDNGSPHDLQPSRLCMDIGRQVWAGGEFETIAKMNMGQKVCYTILFHIRMAKYLAPLIVNGRPTPPG